MLRGSIFSAFLAFIFSASASAQTVDVYQTTPDLLMALSHRQALRFSAKPDPSQTMPVVGIDEQQHFQQIDGFGASLTDAAAWLFSKKLTPAQTDATFKMLFDRKDGIALSFLRQPIGSSDLAVTFYSYDDLCQQTDKACTTPGGASDPTLAHFSLAHDQEYIFPLLAKALAINPDAHVMLSPWSPPGWMKTSGSMLGSNPDTKEPSSLSPEFYPAFANYLVKTIQGYQAAGVPVYALSVQNEPLFAPPTYSGMQMFAEEQVDFFSSALGPAMAAAGLKTKLLAYDHNWDRPEFPEAVLKDKKAGPLTAGTAWHHYAGDPSVMTAIHKEFPEKDQWVTESSGGAWQKGNIMSDEAAELVAVMRNWSRSYVLWALATDQDHGPHVGGCDKCRGIVTINTGRPGDPVTPELDYYVLGHASKFLFPGAARIASDQPAGTFIRDVAFMNLDGTIVLYVVNAGVTSQDFRIAFQGKTVATVLPAGAVATYVWKSR